MDRRILLAFGATAALLAARPAPAVDGVIEINQARVMAGGISPGDIGGFPVTINAPGSYRLTSNLNGVANFNGIDVASDDVTLDLNGFTIVSGGGVITDGISVAGFKNVEIKNGTIRGFTRSGIFTNINTQYIRVVNVTAVGNSNFGIDLQGQGNIIDGCTALSNNNGMRVFEGSLVIDSIVRGNPGSGLTLVGGAGYRSCVLTQNNGGDANPQVSGGYQLGTNVCGTDTVCP
jgi:hypothetical protein